MYIGHAYLKTVIQRFNDAKVTGEKALAQLNESEIVWTPNEASNSVATIVKHMSGNMVSRWTDFLTTDGEKPSRNRDDEFVGDIQTKEQMMTLWETGWTTFLNTLKTIEEEDLLKTVTIRQQPHSVMEAIERQMYHYSYHVGQIVYVAKMLKSNEWHTLTIPKK